MKNLRILGLEDRTVVESKMSNRLLTMIYPTIPIFIKPFQTVQTSIKSIVKTFLI